MRPSLESHNIDSIMSESEIKRCEMILSTFPSNSKYNNKKLLWIIKKFGWKLVAWNPEDLDLNYTEAQSFIEKIMKIKDIIPIHITSMIQRYGRPIFPDGTEGEQKYINYELGSESNVYLIKSKNIVMKMYFALSKSEITNYHKFQNKLSEQKYDIDYNGEIEGKKFNKINIEVMNLPENDIIGNDNAAISFIPMSWYKNLREYWIDKYAPILQEIMKVIKERNGWGNFSESIDPMNIQLLSLENGVLSLRITDISDSILETLKWRDLLDSENPSVEITTEITKKLVWWIINNFGI